MIKIFNQVTLDVSRGNEYSVVYAKQGDKNSRFITATVCIDGNMMIIPRHASVKLNVIRADGVGTSFDGWAMDDGKVTVPLDRWVTAVVGDSRCSVEISYGDQVLSTMRFTVRTEESDDVKDIGDPDILPTDPEYDSVVELLDDYKNGRLGTGDIFVRYSENADGSGFSSVQMPSHYYIGFAVGKEAPADKDLYIWSRFSSKVERGATFIPKVSSDGVISWTNDRGMVDPEPVSIKGTDGNGINCVRETFNPRDGYTGFDIVLTDGAVYSVYVPNGNDGRGISDFSMIASSDEYDLYRIRYTDGSEQTFKIPHAGGGVGKATDSVNVKDFGAKGDGVANDQPAIEAAFAYAVEHLPCEVYFPKGEYGILRGGITVNVPKGDGGLTIRGDGKNLSKIKYLEDWETAGTWYAVRIQPLGKETAPPSDISEYLHDIIIRDIGVYDTDPLAHCWHTDKGDPNTEETHGFDIQYCVRATVRDCLIENVGDEAIDICFCEDVIVANNNVVGSPAAGSSGGAISIGDGSKNVIVEGNTVRKTRADESETVLKRNFGIAVEAIDHPVEKVVIANNVISDINGNGINIGTPGGTITDVTISDNIISDVTNNGIMLSSTNDHINIRIVNNTIRNCGGDGIGNDGDVNGSLFVENCTIIGTFRGIYNNMGEIVISKCNIRDTVGQGIFVTKKAIIDGCILANVCTDIDNYKNKGAIDGYSNDKLDLLVRDTSIITNSVYGTLNANTVINVNVTTNPSYSGTAYGGTTVKYIYGGKISCRAFASIQSGGVVNGLVIDSTVNQWMPAITLDNVTGVIVTNCRITYKGTSKDAIVESGTSDYNIITNNLSSRPITVIGANSVNANNIRIA